jgi:hypothetical protein
VQLCLSGSGSRVEILCCVRVYESASPRHRLVMKHMWSPNPWICGKVIWSRVSPNRFSSPEFIWTHYGQETPKSPQGVQLEMGKVNDVICFPLCAAKVNLLPHLHSSHPFHLCFYLDVWQTGEMGRGQSKNTPLEL